MEDKYLDMASFNLQKDDLFGHYCHIEMLFYGNEGNQFFIFKIVGQLRSNYYNEVPFNQFAKPAKNHGEVIDVVNVIQCGIDESEVFRVPLHAIKILPRGD